MSSVINKRFTWEIAHSAPGNPESACSNLDLYLYLDLDPDLDLDLCVDTDMYPHRWEHVIPEIFNGSLKGGLLLNISPTSELEYHCSLRSVLLYKGRQQMCTRQKLRSRACYVRQVNGRCLFLACYLGDQRRPWSPQAATEFHLLPS